MATRYATTRSLPVVIELNVAYKGGVEAAYQTFSNLVRTLDVIDRVPELFDDYVPARCP